MLRSDGGISPPEGKGPLASTLFTTSTSGGNPQLIGQFNPNALQIEFDLPVTMMHQPQGSAAIKLWGIGLRALGQAANLNPVDGKFKTFVLKGGMSKGLPLANPAQAGIIASGVIFQAFGNWSGLNQTLDLLAFPGSTPPEGGSGIKWEWKKGQPVGDAISETLAQAMPGYTPKVNVSANLLAPNDQPGWYPRFSSWADAIREYTRPLGQQIFGKSYQGVQIAIKDKTVKVFDAQGPTAPKPTMLIFQDLIGQPTWISPTEISFQTVMRADLDLFDYVMFPKEIMAPYALSSPESAVPNAPASSSIAFQGTFVINEIHYFANLRQADAASWNTTFKAIALGSQ